MIDAPLPRGLELDGVWARTARIRPLTGEDEERVHASAGQAPVERVTALLGRCVLSVGGASASEDVARQLTVGDREALALHVRRLTFGERIVCTLLCPAETCRKPMDLTLSVRDLLVAPYDAPRAEHEVTLDVAGDRRTIRFRVPTGADEEEAARAPGGRAAAALSLLSRCVLTPGADVARWPAEVRDEVATAMSEADSQAELRLELTCPECATKFASTLDAGNHLVAEIDARAPSLYREVHLLAFHYHWSEREILSMTARKRGVYLAMLAEVLADRVRS